MNQFYNIEEFNFKNSCDTIPDQICTQLKQRVLLYLDKSISVIKGTSGSTTFCLD